ncbi:MAG TPA: 3-phosphoshikimate 1-carboxyvinyltransferase [bacterium]|nr:3-phosphoshikimate 1-carboxyvinyltransferase [bacterium]HOL35679.1 3-phosphoshikimate 1-carboxyvinyltransferase [bacterium]HPP07510.1 3-phosphoshikimate 1-carboxyvinyltransferase [bacterium]
MNLKVKKTQRLNGIATIPASKSHTIRAVVIASLAGGTSKIVNPLDSLDTMAAVNACRDLGANIHTEKNCWTVIGFNKHPKNPQKILDLQNSGTSFNLICGISCLGNFEVALDGDESLRSRPVEPLLAALRNLGAYAISINNNGKPPVKVKGPLSGGKTTVAGINSQFVSSLLISAPLAPNDTEITVTNLCEQPYVRMTLMWLDEQKILYNKTEDLTHFYIFGNQNYHPFEKEIPGDWSSATFPLVAGAIMDSEILIKGLDLNDVQGDKKVLEYLRNAGTSITITEKGILIKTADLKGIEIDLNSTPDALPAFAVLGCVAEGTTKLYNVPQARIKETDRIRVMAQELSKMGANIQEIEDGLIIRKSILKGASVNGHKDHRVVMALTLAGLIAEGETVVSDAECVAITFPEFFSMMKNLGANIELEGA